VSLVSIVLLVMRLHWTSRFVFCGTLFGSQSGNEPVHAGHWRGRTRSVGVFRLTVLPNYLVTHVENQV